MQTTDKAVAVHYGQDTWSGHDLGYVLEFPQDSLNRGALLQWTSQYPGTPRVWLCVCVSLYLFVCVSLCLCLCVCIYLSVNLYI